MIDLELAAVSRRVVEDLGEVRADEEVLVTVDPGSVPVGRALARAARAADADAILSVMPRLDAHGQEPPDAVAAAMKEVDAVFTANEHAITHTAARKEAAAEGTRVAVLRGVTEEMMIEGGMNADFEAVREATAAACAALEAAESARVESAAGTDVEVSIAGRGTIPIDGYFHDYGFSNLPPGMAVTSPVEGTAEGTVVFDHAMDSIGRLETPIELTVEGGRAVGIEGGEEADRLRELIEAAEGDARNLAELALGTNPAARLVESLAECKKRAGAVDMALGDNSSIGGTVESSLHLDAIVRRPTVTLDSTTVVEAGELDLAALQSVAG